MDGMQVVVFDENTSRKRTRPQQRAEAEGDTWTFTHEDIERAMDFKVGQAMDKYKASHDALHADNIKLREELEAYKAESKRQIFGLQNEVKVLQTNMLTVHARPQSQGEVVTDRVMAVEAKLENQAREDRRRTVFVQGLPEDAPTVNAKATLQGLLPGIGADLLEAKRLGRPCTGPNAKPRPIVARFASEDAKHVALKQSRPLRERHIYRDADLTQEQQRVRRSLQPRHQELRSTNKRPFWRAERLFYTDGDQILETQVGSPLAPPVGRRTPAPRPPGGSGRAAPGPRPVVPRPPNSPRGPPTGSLRAAYPPRRAAAQPATAAGPSSSTTPPPMPPPSPSLPPPPPGPIPQGASGSDGLAAMAQ